MKYDFGGYATRNDLRCSDGRTIRGGAFKHCDGKNVPLVWNHQHGQANNILGHALLESRSDGMYAYCVCNDTESGQTARELVKHGDIEALSIFANNIKQISNTSGEADVIHGDIREVSLVLTGANPGAMIDSVSFEHADGYNSDGEAVIYTGESINPEDVDYVRHAEEDKTIEKDGGMTNDNTSDDRTIQDVYDDMTDEQKEVLHYLVGVAVEAASDSDDDDDDNDNDETVEQSGLYDGEVMKHNIFENDHNDGNLTLTHSDRGEIFEAVMGDARGYGSFRDSMLAHAAEYGIDNIDVLFPDAQDIRNTPDFIKRETAWVAEIMNGTRHTPFARIRSKVADITADEARARGYVKGNQKVNEVITVAKRETTPQTIYKKQKLDRDDVVDITSFDVIAWLWSEMRIMLDEEIARAALLGDGRQADSPDKIKADNIRPIVSDNELYSMKHELSTEAVADYATMIEEISKSNAAYRGSGNPILFTSPEVHNEMLWVKDTMHRRLYGSDAELCSALMVSKIVEVPLMSNFTVTEDGTTYDIYGIKVNLNDYTIGTDRGGQVSQFEDFDIDYNQQKFLIETRLSGALTLPKSAQVYRAAR